MKIKDIYEIALVDGSTRIPKVKRIMSHFFGGKELFKRNNPDEAVANSASIQGLIISVIISLEEGSNAFSKVVVIINIMSLSYFGF